MYPQMNSIVTRIRGRLTEASTADHLKGRKGAAIDSKDVDSTELEMGIAVEMEHTKDPVVAKTIAMDHLAEKPDYYSRLKKAKLADELKEAKAIIVRDRVIKNGLHICPHCDEEIREKSTFGRMDEQGGKMHYFHGSCGGEVIFPPPSPSEQKFLDELRSYVSENVVN